jgi:uncharacterized delta-60 repeat protein
MKNLPIFLALIIFIFVSCLQASVTQKWVARYNGPGNGVDEGKYIAVDGSGNVYVAGTSKGITSGNDYTVVKYNSSGVQQWVQRFNGIANGNDYVSGLVLDASGNVYITGASQGPGHTGRNMDAVTIKYNPAGAQQWIHTFNGFNGWSDLPTSLEIDPSGNLYIGGTTVYSYEDFMTLKYNSSGQLLWANAYTGEFLGFDYGSVSTFDAAGNVYTIGYAEGIGGNFNIEVVKYNSSGVEQWYRQYAGSLHLDDWGVSVLADAAGNVFVGGSASEVQTGYDITAIKYNSSGDQQWLREYNGPHPGGDFTSSMIFDATGNIILTGVTNRFGTQGSDYATVKYDAAGVQQWVSLYSGTPTGKDEAFDVASDAAGNIYVTGESAGNGSLKDYATIVYNSFGEQKSVQRYNGPGNADDIGRSIAVDAAGNIYVTGRSMGRGTNFDFATIKYSLSGSINPTVLDAPAVNKLLENYPNPFNPSTVISYNIAVTGNVSLKVYDVLGNEVAVLVNGIQNAGTHNAQFDAGNLSSGIYFYKLQTESYTEKKKMNLIK